MAFYAIGGIVELDTPEDDTMPKMRSMNATLTDELAAFVDEQIETGRHASQSEVIRQALNLYRDQDDLRKLEWLRARFGTPPREEDMMSVEDVFEPLYESLRKTEAAAE